MVRLTALNCRYIRADTCIILFYSGIVSVFFSFSVRILEAENS